MTLNGKEALERILDINETIEHLKERNNQKEPDMDFCKAVDLLILLRDILTQQLGATIVLETLS